MTAQGLHQRQQALPPLLASSRAEDDRPRNSVPGSPRLQTSTVLFVPSSFLSHVLSLLAAQMTEPHDEAVPSAPPAPAVNSALTSKVSELARVCVGLGMTPPDFSFMRNRQVGPFQVIVI